MACISSGLVIMFNHFYQILFQNFIFSMISMHCICFIMILQNLFILASVAISLFLLALALLINVLTSITILRHAALRKSGYFRLHMVFLVINTIYFFIVFPSRATYAHSALFEQLNLSLPGSTFIAMHPWVTQATSDFLHCILGLQVCTLFIQLSILGFVFT